MNDRQLASLPGPENIHTARLSNGLRVYVYENFATQTVVLSADVLGGSSAESAAQAGLASLTATMLRRGTDRLSFDQLNDTLEAVGASFSFGASRHVHSLNARSLHEDFDLVLELLSESLIQPAFDPGEFDQCRARALTSIQLRADDPRAMAGLSFTEALYPVGHPYRHSLLGYEETVTDLTPDDVRTYYRQTVSPRDGAVVVVGAIEAARAIALLESHLGQWQQPHAQPSLISPPAPALNGRREVRTTVPEKSQSDIILGWPAIERLHPDYFAMLLGNSILGRFGMGGRLGQSVRERQGMAYYVYTTFSANHGAGSWYAAAGVNPENIDKTIAAIRSEVRRMCSEEVLASELADVKANRIGALPLRLETNGGIANNLLTMVWYDLGLDYLQTYPDRIQAISAEDILRVARTYLDPDTYVLAVAGPSG